MLNVIMGVLSHNQSDAIGMPRIWTQTEFFKSIKLTMITIRFVLGVILSMVCQVSQYCPMNLSHLITQSKEE